MDRYQKLTIECEAHQYIANMVVGTAIFGLTTCCIASPNPRLFSYLCIPVVWCLLNHVAKTYPPSLKLYEERLKLKENIELREVVNRVKREQKSFNAFIKKCPIFAYSILVYGLLIGRPDLFNYFS
jgi:hypothetical protein